jgi:hypothetical protein
MKRRVLAASIVIVAAGCADILGLDDGKPRDYDASIDTGVVDAPADVMKDAAADGPFKPLFCGTGKTCNFAAGEACCRTGSTNYQCVDAASACTGTYIPCDRAAYCPQNTEAGALLCCTTDVIDDSGSYVAQSVDCLPAAQCSPPEAGCGPSANTLPEFLICK